MLTLVTFKANQNNGGIAGGMEDFRHAKRLANQLKETVISFGTYSEDACLPGVTIERGVYSLLISEAGISALTKGVLVILPSRQVSNPEVPGTVLVFQEPITPTIIETFGAYISEVVENDVTRRCCTLKVIAILNSTQNGPVRWDPEPGVVQRGLLWKLEYPENFGGKIFLGDEDFELWMESHGWEPDQLRPRRPIGAAMTQELIPVPPTGKLGYSNFIDVDGRTWRGGSGWEKHMVEYATRVNLIRSSNWERFKHIAGEHMVKVESTTWKQKLLSFEHIGATSPAWADTMGFLPYVKLLNIYGKEEMFFSGLASRTDYSLISLEQFVPKTHSYDRKSTFNSLILALDGFRLTCTFYYGDHWKDVGTELRFRLERGDLREYLPEYVNYLVHSALVHFYTIVSTTVLQPTFLFTEASDTPRIFDSCIREVVTVEHLNNSQYWTRYNEIFKSEINFSILSKRKLNDSEPVSKPIKSVTGKSQSGKPPAKIIYLGEKETVCWSDTLVWMKSNTKLEYILPKFQKACRGKTCKFVHLDKSNLPSMEQFLANKDYSRVLTPGDKKNLEEQIRALY